MKNHQFPQLPLLLLLLFLHCRTAPPVKAPATTLSDYFSYSPDKEVLISAHRGGRNYPGYPENCLESIQHVHQQVPNAIFEIDVAQSKDGILFLMHDNSADRTTTGTGTVGKMNWNQLASLQLKDDFGTITNFSIPTLQQVLNWADEQQAILMVDVKRSVEYEKLVEELENSQSIDNAVVITYSPDQAKQLYELNPQLVLSVGMRNQEELEQMEATGIPFQNMVAFTGTRDSPKALFDAIHERGIMCILGTLGNLDKKAEATGDQLYLDFVEKGIDIFATDRPLEVAEILGGGK